MNAILKFIFVVVASYGLLIAVVYFMQSRMLYLAGMPGRTLTMTPIDVGMNYQDVFIASADEVTVHGWFIDGQSSQVLLFFHGNADAAWRYLTEDRGIAASEIIVFGRSLGASVASHLAAQHQPLALIVESSFTSVPDIAAELYPWLPARWLSRFRHATRDYIRDVRCPVLVTHSRDDEIIPYHHGEQIYAAANEPRTLLTIRGSHNDAYRRDERAYTDGVRSFLTAASAHITTLKR